MRCIAHINNGHGRQCKNHTNRGYYCYVHEESIQHLQVKKSTIPNGGLGLFTTIDRKANKPIIPYEGKIIHQHNDHNNHYVLELANNKFIDASNPNSGVARFSNTAKPRNRPIVNNAKYTKSRQRNSANITAKKLIKKGKEILVSYGRTFPIR